MRQQRTVKKVEAVRFVCHEEEEMVKLLSLQQNCRKLTIAEVNVRQGLDERRGLKRCGQDFRAKLARALELGVLGVDTVQATRYNLQGGSRKDLRAIWDGLGVYADGYSSFDVKEVLLENSLATMHLAWNSEELKEELWSDFQLILDTVPEEWPEALKEELEYDYGSDSDSEDLVELELD